MRHAWLVTSALCLLIAPAAATAQNRQCLHGDNEKPADRTRREKAVELAHAINDAQDLARGFRPRGEGGYVPLDRLPKLPNAPTGFWVQLQTDGMGYSFSIKDMMDPCLFGVFSDQSGDVYEATPGPRMPRLKLLTRR